MGSFSGASLFSLQCLHFIIFFCQEKEWDHFSHFVIEGFTSYCKRKRRDKVFCAPSCHFDHCLCDFSLFLLLPFQQCQSLSILLQTCFPYYALVFGVHAATQFGMFSKSTRYAMIYMLLCLLRFSCLQVLSVHLYLELNFSASQVTPVK